MDSSKVSILNNKNVQNQRASTPSIDQVVVDKTQPSQEDTQKHIIFNNKTSMQIHSKLEDF